MKPCSKNRKLIAWLALKALDGRQTQELRAHLGTCEGCRGYLEEISRITERLSTADTIADIEASETFHQKVVARLRAEEPASIWETAMAQLRLTPPNWRVILPVIGAAAVAIMAFSVFARRPAAPLSASTSYRAVMPPNPVREPDPTFSNYQIVANQSLEELDELLTRQGNKNLSPDPVYTVSAPGRAGSQD